MGIQYGTSILVPVYLPLVHVPGTVRPYRSQKPVCLVPYYMIDASIPATVPGPVVRYTCNSFTVIYIRRYMAAWPAGGCKAVGRPASPPLSRTRGCSSFLFPCVYNDANQYQLCQYEKRETQRTTTNTYIHTQYGTSIVSSYYTCNSFTVIIIRNTVRVLYPLIQFIPVCTTGCYGIPGMEYPWRHITGNGTGTSILILYDSNTFLYSFWSISLGLLFAGNM